MFLSTTKMTFHFKQPLSRIELFVVERKCIRMFVEFFPSSLTFFIFISTWILFPFLHIRHEFHIVIEALHYQKSVTFTISWQCLYNCDLSIMKIWKVSNKWDITLIYSRTLTSYGSYKANGVNCYFEVNNRFDETDISGIIKRSWIWCVVRDNSPRGTSRC